MSFFGLCYLQELHLLTEYFKKCFGYFVILDQKIQCFDLIFSINLDLFWKHLVPFHGYKLRQLLSLLFKDILNEVFRKNVLIFYQQGVKTVHLFCTPMLTMKPYHHPQQVHLTFQSQNEFVHDGQDVHLRQLFYKVSRVT